MNTELFLQTLPIMLKGMLGILAVTLVIIGVTILLNRLGNSAQNRKKTQDSVIDK